jgi:hypothetical protein
MGRLFTRMFMWGQGWVFSFNVELYSICRGILQCSVSEEEEISGLTGFQLPENQEKKFWLWRTQYISSLTSHPFLLSYVVSLSLECLQFNCSGD